ncbi:PTS system, cellobiose-specific IIC component [Enterococcus sp. DIV1420a]
MNISGLLIAPLIGYRLSGNRNFKNAIAVAIICLSALIIMMPNVLNISPLQNGSAVNVSGVLSYNNLGTTAMFAGIFVGFAAGELFIKLSKIKKIQIKMDEGVPTAVSDSFNILIPALIVLSIFGTISLVLSVFFNTNIVELVSTIIQEPLRKINTSLLGTLSIYSFGNFLFTLGSHQTVVNGALLDPFLLANMNDNMLAFANSNDIPHIITNTFVWTFGMIGGTGNTISLLIAVFLFTKNKAMRNVSKLSIAPGIFNINEPIIFGLPIVFNIPMMIPFVTVPALGILIVYIATSIGWMNRVVVLIPWTSPPFISAYLATGGDWRAVIVQLFIIVLGVFIYLPFLKISEKVINLNG